MLVNKYGKIILINNLVIVIITSIYHQKRYYQFNGKLVFVIKAPVVSHCSVKGMRVDGKKY